MGFSWAILEPPWVLPGPPERYLCAILAHTWASLGALTHHLGTFLGQLLSILNQFGPPGGSLKAFLTHLDLIVNHRWAILGLSRGRPWLDWANRGAHM